ncbi:hypothetical protein EDD29_8718 [Actinocorallia herbida]|uniref:Uncharacterized protein n=1 Tax=Actinocorallia herbida TaxID=58109 RepID=A0A3N1DBY0_9ACTN|nr:hypothetical protein [Actinocorallia herbida]ROO90976.1 hypothetical protein EDD29_8718 [Actinocorallia herbida]
MGRTRSTAVAAGLSAGLLAWPMAAWSSGETAEDRPSGARKVEVEAVAAALGRAADVHYYEVSLSVPEGVAKDVRLSVSAEGADAEWAEKPESCVAVPTGLSCSPGSVKGTVRLPRFGVRETGTPGRFTAAVSAANAAGTIVTADPASGSVPVLEPVPTPTDGPDPAENGVGDDLVGDGLEGVVDGGLVRGPDAAEMPDDLTDGTAEPDATTAADDSAADAEDSAAEVAGAKEPDLDWIKDTGFDDAAAFPDAAGEDAAPSGADPAPLANAGAGDSGDGEAEEPRKEEPDSAAEGESPKPTSSPTPVRTNADPAGEEAGRPAAEPAIGPTTSSTTSPAPTPTRTPFGRPSARPAVQPSTGLKADPPPKSSGRPAQQAGNGAVSGPSITLPPGQLGPSASGRPALEVPVEQFLPEPQGPAVTEPVQVTPPAISLPQVVPQPGAQPGPQVLPENLPRGPVVPRVPEAPQPQVAPPVAEGPGGFDAAPPMATASGGIDGLPVVTPSVAPPARALPGLAPAPAQVPAPAAPTPHLVEHAAMSLDTADAWAEPKEKSAWLTVLAVAVVGEVLLLWCTVAIGAWRRRLSLHDGYPLRRRGRR